MLKNIITFGVSCCFSAIAFAGQTCIQTLIPGSCTAVCVARDDYGTCTSWQYQGCQYQTVCTTNSVTESLEPSSRDRHRVCSATLKKEHFDAGNADLVGEIFQVLNFPTSFSVKDENGKITLRNNDSSCR